MKISRVLFPFGFKGFKKGKGNNNYRDGWGYVLEQPILKLWDEFEETKVRKITDEERRILKRCPCCEQLIEKATAEDVRKVIRVFKMTCGVDSDDKAWDKIFYPRYVGKAKQLIEFLDGWENAADCIEKIGGNLKDLGRTFTFETILTHSTSWKLERMK